MSVLRPLLALTAFTARRRTPAHDPSRAQPLARSLVAAPTITPARASAGTRVVTLGRPAAREDAAPAAPPRTAFGHDPIGMRVVPLRPESPWPSRRAYRMTNPFRAFPYRALHLARLMAPADPRD